MKTNLKKRLLEWCPQPKTPTSKLKNQTVIHNFFNQKMTITKIAFITLAAIIVLFAFIQIYVPARYHPTYGIWAERLAEEPATYFILDSPDPLVSQAISNPGTSVFTDSLEGTQIDDLIRQHDTGNIKTNGSFYQIGIVYGDSFPPLVLSWLYLISIFALPILVIAIAIMSALMIARFLLKEKTGKADMPAG